MDECARIPPGHKLVTYAAKVEWKPPRAPPAPKHSGRSLATTSGAGGRSSGSGRVRSKIRKLCRSFDKVLHKNKGDSHGSRGRHHSSSNAQGDGRQQPKCSSPKLQKHKQLLSAKPPPPPHLSLLSQLSTSPVAAVRQRRQGVILLHTSAHYRPQAQRKAADLDSLAFKLTP